MSASVIAAAWTLAVFVLIETVLPQAFAALRRWIRQAKTDEKTPMPSPEIPAPVAANDAAIQRPPAPVQRPPSPVQESASLGQRSEADQLWEEARGMAHNFTPDWDEDREYLAKVYAAARLGCLEALVKLGDYAYRRGAVVEAYYWMSIAELKGAKGLERTLRNIRSAWLAEGCPTQRSNTYDGFSEQQGSFARSLLRIHCAVERPLARARMRELAEQGCAEAQLFLRKIA